VSTGPFESDPLKLHAGDTDLSWDAIHHTLGAGPTQAAPGNHKHDGKDSSSLEGKYVRVPGDTMTGNLQFQGGGQTRQIGLRDNADVGHSAGVGLTTMDASGNLGPLTVANPTLPYQAANLRLINNAYIRAGRGNHSLAANTWTMGTGWAITNNNGITIGGSSFSVVPGVFLISTRVITPTAGRVICGADSNDNSYGESGNFLFDDRAAAAGSMTAGSIIISSTGWLRVWFYVGVAQSIQYYVDIAKVGSTG
jgi:hypothetical protein